MAVAERAVAAGPTLARISRAASKVATPRLRSRGLGRTRGADVGQTRVHDLRPRHANLWRRRSRDRTHAHRDGLDAIDGARRSVLGHGFLGGNDADDGGYGQPQEESHAKSTTCTGEPGGKVKPVDLPVERRRHSLPCAREGK